MQKNYKSVYTNTKVLIGSLEWLCSLTSRQLRNLSSIALEPQKSYLDAVTIKIDNSVLSWSEYLKLVHLAQKYKFNLMLGVYKKKEKIYGPVKIKASLSEIKESLKDLSDEYFYSLFGSILKIKSINVTRKDVKYLNVLKKLYGFKLELSINDEVSNPSHEFFVKVSIASAASVLILFLFLGLLNNQESPIKNNCFFS